MFPNKSLLLFWVFLSAQALGVQPLATFGQQTLLRGNGCPAGSYSVALSPDRTTLSIIFDELTSTRSSSHPGYESKFCNISVPVQIAAGYQIRFKNYSLRGFASISQKAFGKLLSLFSIKVSKRTFSNLSTLKFFNPNFTDDFEIASPGRLPAVGCQSSSLELNFKTWIDVYAHRKTPSNNILSLDSFDLSLSPEGANSQVEISKCR